MSGTIYDEIEIEDFDFDPEMHIFYYPCPCGDRFQITEVLNSKDIRQYSSKFISPSCATERMWQNVPVVR